MILEFNSSKRMQNAIIKELQSNFAAFYCSGAGYHIAQM
jgi:hypothetical protein